MQHYAPSKNFLSLMRALIAAALQKQLPQLPHRGPPSCALNPGSHTSTAQCPSPKSPDDGYPIPYTLRAAVTTLTIRPHGVAATPSP